jgi:hypothetical protein
MRTTRGRRGPTAALLLACVTGVLAACSEVAVVTPTPSPTVAPSLPPIGFNHRYGNNPVAAADGFELERTLFARKDYWEMALATTPVEAGYVDRANPGAVTTARAAVTELTMVIASEALATIRSFLANGHPGQLSYCTGLLDDLRTKGYTGVKKITVYIYFGEQDRHAVITWKEGGSYDLQVLDNDLKGTSVNPNPSSTPFQAPPTP